jgi:prevent-host-death family protein
MSRSYSIAEAKNVLGRVVHEAEEGPPVELTRRGRPVAVVVSIRDFERLTEPGQDFWAAYEGFRRRFDLEALAIEPEEVFAVEHDPSPGQDFSW